MIDWNDYWYFALIAEEGSYSRAAIRAQVSKSVLSRRMSALEEQLGVHLIQRTTRRLALTKVGEQFAQECQKLVNQSERARAVVQAVQEYPQGTLRISAPVFMAETWLGALINEFIARWPLANVQLLAVNRPVDMIAEGIDIALSVSSGALPDSSLHYKKINTLYDILVASPQWVEQYPDLKTIGDLHRAPAMVRLADGRMQSWHLINGSQEITLSLSPVCIPIICGFCYRQSLAAMVWLYYRFRPARKNCKTGTGTTFSPSGLASQDRFMHYSQRTKECPQLHAILWTS